jgi:hypothetical protein
MSTLCKSLMKCFEKGTHFLCVANGPLAACKQVNSAAVAVAAREVCAYKAALTLTLHAF